MTISLTVRPHPPLFLRLRTTWATAALPKAGSCVAFDGQHWLWHLLPIGAAFDAAIAAIVSNGVYWQLDSLSSAYVVSVIAGAAYMTGTLIQLDLTARIIPARAAATVFATVMALTNFAGSGSEAFGGWLFGAAKASYGREMAFSLAVAVSVAAAVSCWLLVPMLRRAAPQWWD